MDGPAVAHAGQIDVVGVLAGAEDLLGHVQPVNPGADLPVIRRGAGDDADAEDLRRQPDGRHDLHIAGAAADVVADGVADLRLRGVEVFVQQALGTDHHAGDAEAALDGSGLAEGVGVDRPLEVGQALHGHDVLSRQLVGADGAGPDSLSVDQDGAGAAGALAAAILGGGQMQFIAQKAQQGASGILDSGLVDKEFSHGNSPPQQFFTYRIPQIWSGGKT